MTSGVFMLVVVIHLSKGSVTRCSSGCGTGAAMGLNFLPQLLPHRMGLEPIYLQHLAAPLPQPLPQVLVWTSPLVTMEPIYLRHQCRSCCRSMWTSLKQNYLHFLIVNNGHISNISYLELTNYAHINQINQFQYQMNNNANTYEL